MAKSRAKRSRKKRFDNFRNTLFWILCCGRRTVREYEETVESKGEKVAEPEHVIEEVSYNKRDMTAGVPGAPEGPPSPNKTKKQAPPPPKRMATPVQIGSTTDIETLKQDQLDAIEKKIAEIEPNRGKNLTSQQHSSAHKAAAELSKKTLDEYPEQLNPFADDQDDGDEDDCCTSEVGKKEKGGDTIGEYPEDLNPFSDKKEGQKETDDNEHQVKINKE